MSILSHESFGVGLSSGFGANSLLIVTAMLVLQFMTWRSIERVATSMPSSPPDCDYRRPCHVQGIVSLDNDTIRRISR